MYSFVYQLEFMDMSFLSLISESLEIWNANLELKSLYLKLKYSTSKFGVQTQVGTEVGTSSSKLKCSLSNKNSNIGKRKINCNIQPQI